MLERGSAQRSHLSLTPHALRDPHHRALQSSCGRCAGCHPSCSLPHRPIPSQSCTAASTEKGICLWQGTTPSSTSLSSSSSSSGQSACAAPDFTDYATVASLDAVAKSAFCSRAECCSFNYAWSGTTLKCWSSMYTSYEDDPCSCIAVRLRWGAGRLAGLVGWRAGLLDCWTARV